jgi:hypothetical protein
MAQQVNGLPTWETWSQNMTDEQRRYEMFRLLYSISCRVDKLERRPMWDKALAFTGGLIGGFAAVIAYFFTKSVGV